MATHNAALRLGFPFFSRLPALAVLAVLGLMTALVPPAANAQLVIIGAIAYQIHFPGQDRHTRDIDFAVALDLSEFAVLSTRLCALGWNSLGLSVYTS